MEHLLKEIEKNFPKVEKFFSKGMLAEFLHTPINRIEKYNFGLGTMIRLKLLRPKSILYKKFVKYGVTDREKITMKIIIEFHKYALKRNKSF